MMLGQKIRLEGFRTQNIKSRFRDEVVHEIMKYRCSCMFE